MMNRILLFSVVILVFSNQLKAQSMSEVRERNATSIKVMSYYGDVPCSATDIYFTVPLYVYESLKILYEGKDVLFHYKMSGLCEDFGDFNYIGPKQDEYDERTFNVDWCFGERSFLGNHCKGEGGILYMALPLDIHTESEFK